MSRTPPGKDSRPPATPGFAAALFGGLWSTAKKKPRNVDSSTLPTPSVTRTPRVHYRHPEISLQFPSEQESTMLSNDATALAIDLLDTEMPLGSPDVKLDSSTSFPVKSPWKSPSAPSLNGTTTFNVQFSMGNLKAPPSERRSSVSQASRTANRRRYRPSTLLVPARRRRTGPVNPTNAVNALQNSLNLFQPSNRQTEVRNNYTSFRAGKRLLGSSQIGGSRLAPTSNETEEPTSPVERASKRRKQVLFGDAVDVTPVESEVMTPVRPSGQKRKGTPFKAATETESPVVPSENPTSYRKPSIGPKPQTKLRLEKGNYTFESSGEEKSLGPAVATRTPLFFQNASVTLDVPLDLMPARAERRFENEVAKPTVKDSSKPVAKDSFIVGSTVKSRPERFKCHSCQAETSIEENKCSKCGTVREVLTSGWGDLFADQKKRWKCNVCSVQNEQSVTECVACETPREGHESKVTSSSTGGATSGASIGTGGFSFGGVPTASAPSSGGLKFGSSPATKSLVGSFNFGGPLCTSTTTPMSVGGFTFGAAPALSIAKPSGGFTFGTEIVSSTGEAGTPTVIGISSTAAPPLLASSINSVQEKSARPPIINFGSTPASNTEKESKDSVKPIGFSFAPTPQAPSNGEKATFKFNVTGDEKKCEDATKPNLAFPLSESAPSNQVTLHVPATEPSGKETTMENRGCFNVPSSASKASDTSSKPLFSFGGSAETSSNPSTSFSFGSTSAPPAVSKPISAPAFKFGSQASSNEAKAIVPLGSLPSIEAVDEDRSKRRRGPDDGDSSSAPSFGATTNSAPAPIPAFNFSSSVPTPTTFGSQPPKDNSVPAFGASAPAPVQPSGGFSFGAAAAPSSSSNFKFGDTSSTSATALASETIENAPAPLFGGNAPTQAALFGSSQTLVPSFGTAAPVTVPSNANPFGSAPSSSSTFSFGAGPAPAPTAFSSTPASASMFGAAPTTSAPTFGVSSTTAPGSFGAAAPHPSFGSTPAAPHPSFGSTTPAPSAPFGSAPPFGAAPTGGFGGGFGVAAPAPAAFGFGGAPPAPDGFSSGFPAQSPAPGSFGDAGGFGTPAGDAVQFNIGTGGGSKAKGGRRFVKAKRPVR